MDQMASPLNRLVRVKVNRPARRQDRRIRRGMIITRRLIMRQGNKGKGSKDRGSKDKGSKTAMAKAISNY